MATRLDRIYELIPRIKEQFTISEAFKGRVLELQGTSSNIRGLCPFHNDRKVGNFSGTDSKGIWKCFACGAGGDAISFVRDYENLHGKNYNYLDVALQIALEKGIVTKSEYEQLTVRKFSKEESLKIERTYTQKDKEEIADINTLDKVYSLFIKGNELQGKERLTIEHREHLKNVRHLSDEEIEHVGYFTFPKGYVNRQFLNVLEENNIPLETLKKVPGFFFNKTKEKFEFTTYPGSSIGIPIRNIDGKIVAIQLRKDTIREKETRYIWFSSAWAKNKADKQYGCSCGAPVNVIYPKEKTNNDIYITEGHFKGMILAKTLGSIVLSVQGVSTWKSLLPLLENIPHKNIFIAYDADMAYNEGVFLQAIKMGITMTKIQNLEILSNLGRNGINQDEVMKNIYDVLYQEYMDGTTIRKKGNKCLNIRYLLWNAEDGKGIDDYLEHHYFSETKSLNVALMYSKYVAYIKALQPLYKNLPENEDIPKDIRAKKFNDIMF